MVVLVPALIAVIAVKADSKKIFKGILKKEEFGMEQNELQALKELVDSTDWDTETDLDMGGCSVGNCSHCCSTSKGGF